MDIHKIFAGIILIALGVVFIKPHLLPVPTSANSFSSEPVQVTGLTERSVTEDKIPVRVLIPSVSIDLPVKTAHVKNGYWEVFKDNAGWGEGSGIPGEKGNVVIFAHAKKEMFAPLRDIKKDAEVLVFTKEKWFSYKVESIRQVYPNNTAVIAQTDDETITLYTCSGFGDAKRLIVSAKSN